MCFRWAGGPAVCLQTSEHVPRHSSEANALPIQLHPVSIDLVRQLRKDTPHETQYVHHERTAVLIHAALQCCLSPLVQPSEKPGIPGTQSSPTLIGMTSGSEHVQSVLPRFELVSRRRALLTALVASKLLGFAAAWICHDQGAIVSHQYVLIKQRQEQNVEFSSSDKLRVLFLPSSLISFLDASSMYFW